MEGFEGDRQGSGCVGVIHIPRHAFLSTPRKHPSALTGCPCSPWSTIVIQRTASEHGGSAGGPTPPPTPSDVLREGPVEVERRALRGPVPARPVGPGLESPLHLRHPR